MSDRTRTKVVDGPSHAAVADTVAAPEDGGDGDPPPAAMFRALGADDFQLRDEVARGGMGRVIRAFDRRLQRVVAIKQLVDDSIARRARFAREARITAQLQHPSIVPVYDAGTLDNGELVYAMKLVSGRELQAAIADAKSLADRLPLVPRVVDVAEAIAYAHAHRVVHRDLKPSNIILGEFGETIVIDWGIAKELDVANDDRDNERDDRAELTQAGSIVGTPAYMAPEQALGDDRLDDRADVYALGAILYELLAGKPAYDAPDSTSMLARIVAGPPAPLETVEPGVPRALAAIVRRAMAREPRDRCTAKELAVELRRFMAGQLVASHRYSLGERLVRWLRRRKEAVAVAAIALAVIAVGAVGSATRIVHERDAAEAAQAREAARADELLVARAATLAASDPIAAVGLLHELPAESASWRAARDVLAAARAHGVPWEFAVSHETRALAIARDGSVAYAAGDDGAVRRLDLARGEVSIVRRGDPLATLALAHDDRVLAIATGAGTLELVDLASNAVTTTKLASPIARLLSAGATLAWADRAGDIWALAGDATTPARVAAGVRPSTLAISADGRDLASAEAASVVVYDLAGTALARHDAAEAALAWSPAGHRLAIGTFTELVELDVDAQPAPTARTIRAGVASTLVYVGDDLYFKSAQTVFRAGDGGVEHLAEQPEVVTFAGATRDAAVYSTITGAIVIAGRGGLATLRAPSPRLLSGAATAAGSKLVVAAADHVYAYDAADVVARPLDTHDGAVAGGLGFASDDRLLVTNMFAAWQLFDLATGSAASLGPVGRASRPITAPDGSYVLARRDRELVLLRPGAAPAAFGNANALAASADRFELIDGRDLVDVSLPSLARRVAWHAAERIRDASTTPQHVAAATTTALWRRLGGAGTSESIALPEPISTLAIARDGTVYIAVGPAIYRWGVGADSLAWHAALARPVAALWAPDAGPVIARDAAGSLWTVARAGFPPVAALPDGVDDVRVASDGALAAGVADGELRIYDLETHQRWSLGAVGLEADVAISPTGRRIATTRAHRAAIIDVDLATTRADYERALDALTNLRVTPP